MHEGRPLIVTAFGPYKLVLHEFERGAAVNYGSQPQKRIPVLKEEGIRNTSWYLHEIHTSVGGVLVLGCTGLL